MSRGRRHSRDRGLFYTRLTTAVKQTHWWARTWLPCAAGPDRRGTRLGVEKRVDAGDCTIAKCLAFLLFLLLQGGIVTADFLGDVGGGGQL